MASELKQIQMTPRDGTSQPGRKLAALDPGYVSVDERTIEDLVAFARVYGEGLIYYGPDDKPAGTWKEFVGSLDPKTVAAFMREPEKFSPETSPALFRPHFVLFLAFLKLFDKLRTDKLNTLTGRHLDFYYREVLRMAHKGPIPDQVHVIVDLAKGKDEALVPGGTLLSAGPDSLGKARVYATDGELVVNRIQIAELRSLFVEKRRTGIRQAWQQHLNDPYDVAFLAMLQIALGSPPGQPLVYDGQTVNFDKLKDFRDLIDLDDLPRLRDLMRQANLPDPEPLAEEDEWKIDNVLAIEAYFCMPAERFAEVIDEATSKPVPEWKRVFSTLEDAHKEQVRKARRQALKQLHEADPQATVVPLIGYVLGEDPGSEEDAALRRLQRYLNETDFKNLKLAVTENDWEGIYRLLEVAQRNRIGEPPAEKEEWLNVVPEADATAVRSHRALEGQRGSQWATFGQSRPIDQTAPPAPVLGWAISSPLLALREGTRTVTLTLGFRADEADSDKLGELLASERLPLLFEVSTGKGWVECGSVGVAIDSYAALTGTTLTKDPLGVQFTLDIEASAGPIAPLPAELAEIDGEWPMLRLMLRPIWSEAAGQYVAHYRELGGLIVDAAHMEVTAKGLRALKLQNDEATLNAKKPFEPFGRAPAVGSRFLIGHPEVVTKKLDSLIFAFEWMGAPSDMKAHYANYGLEDPIQFTARICMNDGAEETQLESEASLFGSTQPASIKITADDLVKEGSFETLSAGALGPDLSGWRRCLSWTLNEPDFQHGSYPAVAAGKAVELAGAIANNETIVPGKYKVNPPYTPKIKSLTLDYSAAEEIQFGAGDVPADRVLYIHPFGYCEVEEAGLPFLPQYDNDGELYIGLRDVSPPQTVALLFQMAEGSADPDVKPPPIQWSYLSGNGWEPLAHRMLLDTTQGLVSSGIVKLALESTKPSHLLPGDLYWVRATVARDTAGVCDTTGIHAQAVPATFVDRGNAPDHYRSPLAPETITKLVSEIPGIKGVRQLYASFGGQVAEDGGLWATRVSERLRHKQRALSMWDYERLVLEQFPQIYKAKCIPMGPDEPGKVEIIVIPDIRNLRPFDPFKPKAPSNLLADVEEYLGTKTPAFVSVNVKNPHYVAVRVHLAVRFKGDVDEGFYTRKLIEELIRFLSPWAYEDGPDIVLGGRIYASSIVDFVDRRPYVDFVAGVTLFRSDDGENFKLAREPAGWEGDWQSDFVEADQADVVLVAARTHEVNVLHDAVYEAELMQGINFMKVELDFIVA